VIDAPYTLDESFGLGGYNILPEDPANIWIEGGTTWGLPYGFGLIGLGIDQPIYGFRTTLPFGAYKKAQVIWGTSDSSSCYWYRRFTDGTGPDGVRFRFQGMVKLPISAWDIEDPLNPHRLNIAWRDRVGDGAYHIDYDPLLVCASAYDPTGTYYVNPLIPGGPFETDAMYIFDPAVISGHTEYESPDTVVIQPFYANKSGDVFSINTANYKATAGKVDVAKTQIDRINAVPNPYFAANAYEHNQFNKVMRFTNLPAVAKIRIFNLLGELVNVLDKNDPATTSIDWNLTNRNSLPVASGMYIVHIDMGAIGTKIIKVAVIMAEERLDNF
jgi:hypothetical protein